MSEPTGEPELLTFQEFVECSARQGLPLYGRMRGRNREQLETLFVAKLRYFLSPKKLGPSVDNSTDEEIARLSFDDWSGFYISALEAVVEQGDREMGSWLDTHGK